MKLTDISNLRLINQKIANSNFTAVTDLAHWMGAIQAQDYGMSKWAIGLRVKNSTEKLVEDAIDKGKIIRTHLLRPTWHFVAAEDIHWLLKLTSPRIKASMKSRHKELELTDAVLAKTNEFLREAIKGGSHLTREEIMLLFKDAGIKTENNRWYHILSVAELDGILCSGKIKNNKQTYALLSERVPETQDFSKEDALKKIASKYFISHGPATIHDFTWWSGLSPADSRNALEMVKPGLISETTDNITYWFSETLSLTPKDNDPVYLLPAFDEFIISYKNRTTVLPLMNHKKAVSDNGIFRPVIIVNGIVGGLWKRTVNKDKVFIETSLFQSFNKKIMKSIEKKAEEIGNFLDRKVEIRHNII